MQMTQTLPTDRWGNVYYGPRTFAEAEETLSVLHTDMLENEKEDPDLARRQYRQEIADMADRLDAAGYPGVAARVRREYLA